MKQQICIIEDTRDLLENLSSFLKLEGFDVLPCKSGEEALEILKDRVPALIITDLWMPGMDGFVLVGEIRKNKRLAGVPLAVYSAAQLSDAEKDFLKDKISGYIKKPISMDGMLECINGFLKK